MLPLKTADVGTPYYLQRSIQYNSNRAKEIMSMQAEAQPPHPLSPYPPSPPYPPPYPYLPAPAYNPPYPYPPPYRGDDSRYQYRRLMGRPIARAGENRNYPPQIAPPGDGFADQGHQPR